MLLSDEFAPLLDKQASGTAGHAAALEIVAHRSVLGGAKYIDAFNGYLLENPELAHLVGEHACAVGLVVHAEALVHPLLQKCQKLELHNKLAIHSLK